MDGGSGQGSSRKSAGCNNCVALVLAGERFDEVIVTVLTVSWGSPRDHEDGDPQLLTLLPVRVDHGEV
jgi:hypothetical protein